MDETLTGNRFGGMDYFSYLCIVNQLMNIYESNQQERYEVRLYKINELG